MKKKKNDSLEESRNRFILIASILSLVLIFGIGLLANAIIQNRANQPFSQTTTHLAPINPVIATLLVETSIAGTEHASVTNTAQP